MNILPKKRWHVRTKDNIARVRKDEAAAREEERKKQDKLKLAESEARVNFLRKCSGLPEKKYQEESEKEKVANADAAITSSQHVDLFADYKSHIKTTNKDLEKEKKEEQEKYEKQIGYLTYLGQDTNEALRLKSWYEVAPKRLDVGSERGEINEKDLKIKHNHDPLTFIKSLLPADSKLAAKPLTKRKRSPSPQPSVVQEEDHSKLSKKSKKSKKDHKTHKAKKHKKRSKVHKKEKVKEQEDNRMLKLTKIEQLRKERLRRETTERARQEALLAPKESTNKIINEATPKIVQKYNSQFNPELAKQNLN